MAAKATQATDELRKNDMMAHLLDALDGGGDVGHYGRLVFTMVSRHFMDEEELVGWLTKDTSFTNEDARSLFLQVQERDYNPPKRDKVLEWQAQQDFAICPNPNDPTACNVYRDLQFPDGVYEHIQEFYEEQADSHR